jgi:hypothetical protein
MLVCLYTKIYGPRNCLQKRILFKVRIWQLWIPDIAVLNLTSLHRDRTPMVLMKESAVSALVCVVVVLNYVADNVTHGVEHRGITQQMVFLVLGPCASGDSAAQPHEERSLRED